ncbi:hypothetical protein EVAR_12651_1 [Eumeta japonica]|uniref:Uncharacterized protein n=1 Tax=Eumeta variegata TaxID=151549 RepID=A0A4C1ZAY5_EUMVA|nr:hypothetical protein EVAR_12651_1 [Eumeta japonica]
MNGSRLEPYIGTQCHFTESQNVARLRKALKGDARENVKSLLYSGASADDILDSLQRKEHYLKDCATFTALPIDERWERAKKAHVCFRCLSNTHYRSECRARPCGKDGCKKTHHKLLYQDRASTDETNGQISSINVLLKKERVFLKIIPVEISGPLGRLETYAPRRGFDDDPHRTRRRVKIAPPGKIETFHEVVEINRPLRTLNWDGYCTAGNGIARPVHVINYIAREPSAEDEIGKLIKENFSIECLGIEAKKPSNDLEQRALKVLDDTSRRLPDGRFEIGLIWKTDNEIMPDNKRYAEKRLCNLEKKFKKNKIFYNEYKLQIANLLEKRYAEPAPEAPASPRTWYLPHFAVVHPQKGKIRLVFDAAARTAGRSLNDALLPGPDLLQSLFGVLLRFREGRVAVVADIREMFLVKIREEDRDSLRFLWRKMRTKSQEFRMNSLIFASSSPCSAIYVKN